ncbi:hypothetical protein EUX98_g3880 [Antrodiella citrinella]|uniref:Ras-GEF domain-containing protein n=1 Tax=Antrodiella citrinella TaxID=2447956 RepID=A0A4S4MVE9_9APHY|nr:hypothetical protein EUX98_g3880 [Antrodiella citrinella]
MITQAARLADNTEDDGSRVPTPIAHNPRLSETSTIFAPQETQSSSSASEEGDGDSASLVSDANSAFAPSESSQPEAHAHFLLPTPTSSSSRSQSLSASSDSSLLPSFVDLPSLPEDLAATAEVTIAPDGSFVETSSGAAARELKRIYDHRYGVGKEVRSPYAITAFVNQHGKQMYRLGTRELSAPAATTAEDADVSVSTRAKSQSVTGSVRDSLSSHATKAKRGSRMSVHSFLPPTMFNKNVPGAPVQQKSPPEAHVDESGRSPPTRKLRKTRSIPNLVGAEGSIVPATQAPASNGRPHAHSVSSADAFRVSAIVAELGGKPVQQDILSSVLTWDTTAASPYSARSALPPPSVDKLSPDLIANPFGPDVHFDSPGWRSSTTHLTSPILREMQSFESGLTARADPSPRASRTGKLHLRTSDEFEPVPEQVAVTSSLEELTSRVFEPSAEPSTVSRYSTDLFDVLQNYRGLPALDKISPMSPETTIKLSMKSEETAAPKDDPRFVIWGEVEVEDDGFDITRASATDLSSSHSAVSRRRSSKRHTVAALDAPSVRVSSGEGPKKVLVAATIERWIAQLTSELNYDELLIFFLTYRTYISAEDLGHLLICRFHWALAQPTSTHDEMVRRIVRVRTFIAIRYWLLTFFTVDFVPNRELRLLFASWMNSLLKDPILGRHKDAMNLVRKLRKVVLDCRDAHTRKGRPTRPSMERTSSASNSYTLPALGDLSDGHFADSLRKAVTNDEDGDIDLDFDGLTSTGQGFRLNASALLKNPNTPVDLALLRQPLLLAFLQHGKQSAPTAAPAPRDLALPVPHSAISRVIVNTMGRLGRWKRVLNARSQTRAPLGCVDGSGFDLEGAGGEVGSELRLSGGVEQYLKAVDNAASQVLPSLPAIEMSPNSPNDAVTPTMASQEPPSLNEAAGIITSDATSPAHEEEPSRISESTENGSLLSPAVPSLSHAATDTSVSSLSERHSTESSSRRRRWPLDVVSLDDLDLSDLSSGEEDVVEIPHPPGLKKLPRRLPNRRDFEFVRQSIDSVSSMGIQTHRSVMSAGSSSVLSSGSASGVELGGGIQQWQVNALVDSLSDDGEDGDIEAALRRLEGQINQDKQKAKQSKVDGWVQSIRERMANGLYGAERTRYPSDDEEDYGQVQDPTESSFSQSSISSRSSMKSAIAPPCAPGEEVPVSAPPTKEDKPDEDAIPQEIVSSRLIGSRPSTSAGPAPNGLVSHRVETRSFAPPSGKFYRKGHKSFVDAWSSAELVQHFSMIDRELLLNLDFEELVSLNWTASADLNILDWGEFLKERARAKLEKRPLADALTVIRARFNLVANFVISEIVLTHPGDRHKIIAKFIRVAFKAYNLRNFHLLVAVIAGLRSNWVTKATKQAWNRVGMWESRMLNNLILWTTAAGDFKYIRATVNSLAEAKSTVPPQDASNVSTDGQSSTTRSRATSEGKPPPPPPTCVPFFGVYLSSLLRYSSLPDLVDPTSPNEPVVIDPTSNLFESPAHPEVFATLAPLPASVQLEPLINVHKQRLIADVVKSLVAGQHLAAKLRGLDADTLGRALALYAGER